MEKNHPVFPKILIFIGYRKFHHDPVWIGLGLGQKAQKWPKIQYFGGGNGERGDDGEDGEEPPNFSPSPDFTQNSDFSLMEEVPPWPWLGWA